MTDPSILDPTHPDRIEGVDEEEPPNKQEADEHGPKKEAEEEGKEGK